MAEANKQPVTDPTDKGDFAKLGLGYLFQVHERMQNFGGQLLSFLFKTLFIMNGAAVVLLVGFLAQISNKDPKILAKVIPAISNATTFFLIGVGLCALAIFFAWGFADLWSTAIQRRFARIKSVDSLRDISNVLDFDLTKKTKEKDRPALIVILAAMFLSMVGSGILFGIGALRTLDAFQLLAVS